MGFSETLVKVVFWPRIRKAKKIGDAAALIGQGRADETLRILETMERRIPPYLGHLFFLTRGRALDELGQLEEAEKSYIAAVFAKEGATIAHIHLAVLCGRERRFSEARDWLRRLGEDKEAEQSLIAQATELEAMLDDVETGKRQEEIVERARAFEESRGLTGLDVEEAFAKLQRWLEGGGEEALEQCDELACYLGEAIRSSHGGEWELSLALESSFIQSETRRFHPFEVVRRCLDEEAPLRDLITAELTAPEHTEPAPGD